MKTAIIKYNAGNIFSVSHALKRLGVEAILTDNPEELLSADKIIFPGLNRLIRDLKQPVLGICLGMQLMCRHSEEGDVDCLGIFDTDVKRFLPQRQEDKVPHTGWDTISSLQDPLFKGLSPEEYVYFVHSFYVPVNPFTAAVTDYILPFSAALHKDNYYATQFHPEKSGRIGERILTNFLEL